MDILSNELGTNKKKKLRTHMVIFADYSAAEEYEGFMDRILQDNRYELVGIDENWDMNGTLTKIITYWEFVNE